MAAKRAILVVHAVNVVCPHCCEAAPAPDNGSDMWLPEHLEWEKNVGPRECKRCGKTFLVERRKTAVMP